MFYVKTNNTISLNTGQIHIILIIKLLQNFRLAIGHSIIFGY
jgi:hypothetical protein